MATGPPNLSDSDLNTLTTSLIEDIYDITSTIKDPEFPDKILGELKTSFESDKFVINQDDIHVKIFGKNGVFKIFIELVYTPTVSHCSLTSLRGALGSPSASILSEVHWVNKKKCTPPKIGLTIRSKLSRDFPIKAHDTILYTLKNETFQKYFYKNNDITNEENIRFSVKILVFPGSHSTENEVNRQVNDKERVLAALESSVLVSKIEELIVEEEWSNNNIN